MKGFLKFIPTLSLARQAFPDWVPGGWVRKAENKAKAQHRTDTILSKLIAELQHSAKPGSWSLGLAELGNSSTQTEDTKLFEVATETRRD